MRSNIPVDPVRISSIAATTPDYPDIGTLFEAWCSGAQPGNSRASADFAILGEAALAELLTGPKRQSRSTGLLLATTKGDIETQSKWIRAVDEGAATRATPPTLSDSLAKFLPSFVNGPSYVVSTACTSGLVALIESAILLSDGEAETMVSLGVDVAGDFVREGFQALRAISPTACRPFDRTRDGLMLGSAGAGVLLKSETSTTDLCAMTGWAITNDAAHMTAPDRQAGGLIRAIEQALHSANLQPLDIDVVFAHGTGTKYNDAMEAVAIDNVFLKHNTSPAVTAVKGLIGHTLGAAGVIEAALGVQMLLTQMIPPITGLIATEWPNMDCVTTARRGELRHILKIASGFGGMNAAIILSRLGAA